MVELREVLLVYHEVAPGLLSLDNLRDFLELMGDLSIIRNHGQALAGVRCSSPAHPWTRHQQEVIII